MSSVLRGSGVIRRSLGISRTNWRRSRPRSMWTGHLISLPNSQALCVSLATCHSRSEEQAGKDPVRCRLDRKSKDPGCNPKTRTESLLRSTVLGTVNRCIAVATPTGFEPAISALTGQYVKPLHHGADGCLPAFASLEILARPGWDGQHRVLTHNKCYRKEYRCLRKSGYRKGQ